MLVRCQDAAFGYDGHVVVGGLNFSVDDGDYLCIAGENGSGKSTLVKGILRLISPLKGSITIDEKIKKSETGYLSQQAAAKNDFPAGVEEIVLSGNTGAMGLRPFYSRAEKQRAEENMERLSITDLRKRCYRELSGGQQRRVLVARSLCAARRLLVLDEPAAGLDPLIAAELYELLKKNNQETGITIIMVSHDVRTAGMYANKVLHVKNRQCFFGETAAYLDSDLGKEFCSSGKRDEDAR
ncbi:MAG: ATP-binding cassette domain-containing protein [Treponema sp.]|jgi:zinc transport system ATP-binding protein|nr:ATP-binding cassette domain-containing protein [Treponema sp.]